MRKVLFRIVSGHANYGTPDAFYPDSDPQATQRLECFASKNASYNTLRKQSNLLRRIVRPANLPQFGLPYHGRCLLLHHSERFSV